MISIAMATYNGAKYIREQIDSILVQTIQNFKLIICDDCSTDDTILILDEYAKNDSRIQIYKNKENIGFKKNFEQAISRCQDDYIALADQDDIWMPNHLEILLSIIGDKDIACGNCNLIDSKGKPIGLTLSQMEAFDKEYEDNLQKAYSLIYFRSPYQGASMLIKKDFFEKALPIPERVRYHDSWFSIMSCFNAGIIYTPQIVNLYRMHGNNVTGVRVKRKSRIKTLICQLIFANTVEDRPAIIRTIRERTPYLTEEQKKFLLESEKVLGRSSSFFGKIRNTFFRISHYKLIYNCM